MDKVAVILIRSRVNVDVHIRDTLDKLNLTKRLTCVVYDKTPSIMGMIEKVKDYTTYGEIDEETLKLLQEKKSNSNKPHVFHLNPPKGGFERKGIKKPFSIGGALGYRGEKINDLIKRMI
ncbi:MAG: large subunit ribosomal protein [Candidatus Woesearchaeota archaeon]|nr:large subunit ribosomal protein [Candidatus Woesearchaeota archaeon]MDN5327997.1 large subunit ribosomal protein [Candidatus Woesearchaeota archaeon]